MTYIDVQIGDMVQFRKKHACGGREWRVVRTGADIGLVCLTCQRRIMMPRDKFRRLVKKLIPSEKPGVTAPESLPGAQSDPGH